MGGLQVSFLLHFVTFILYVLNFFKKERYLIVSSSNTLGNLIFLKAIVLINQLLSTKITPLLLDLQTNQQFSRLGVTCPNLDSEFQKLVTGDAFQSKSERRSRILNEFSYLFRPAKILRIINHEFSLKWLAVSHWPHSVVSRFLLGPSFLS